MASTSKVPTSKAPKKVPEPAKEAQPAASSSEASELPKVIRKPNQQAPILEPWMRQTVALKLKEVDGRVPDMTNDVFSKKMLLDQGFSKAETLSITSFKAGIFFITFATINICRRYWEAVKTAAPESPFSRFMGNCPIQREERRITVSMRNPHIPGKDVTTFLKRFCTVVRDPTHILNSYGFWIGKWSVVVRLFKDPTSEDGLQHLPSTFFLGNSHGLIYYPDMPQTCRRCGRKGHQMKDCTENACKNCRVSGHETKDCPKAAVCNLCGKAAHMYKACPLRDGLPTWASVAARAPTVVYPAPAETPVAAKKKEKPAKKKEGKIVPPPLLVLPPPSPARSPPSTPTKTVPSSLPPVSVVLSPPPRATYPTAVALTPPPAAAALSPEDFPPLPPAGTLQRKRKVRDSQRAEVSKKLIVEACPDPQPEAEVEEVEEMEHAEEEQVAEEVILEEYVDDDEVDDYPESRTPSILIQFVEECLQDLCDQADDKDEEPPDLGGN